jgi:hypothetical protein
LLLYCQQSYYTIISKNSAFIQAVPEKYTLPVIDRQIPRHRVETPVTPVAFLPAQISLSGSVSIRFSGKIGLILVWKETLLPRRKRGYLPPDSFKLPLPERPGRSGLEKGMVNPVETRTFFGNEDVKKWTTTGGKM